MNNNKEIVMAGNSVRRAIRFVSKMLQVFSVQYRHFGIITVTHAKNINRIMQLRFVAFMLL